MTYTLPPSSFSTGGGLGHGGRSSRSTGGDENSPKKAPPLAVCVLVLALPSSSLRCTTISPEKTLSYRERPASATRKTDTGRGAGIAGALLGRTTSGLAARSGGFGRARLRKTGCAVSEAGDGLGAEEGRLERGMTLPVFFQRTPQALHKVFGPCGPARHSGVSVVLQ